MEENFNFLQEEKNQPKKRSFREKYLNLLKKYRRTKHMVTALLVVIFILGIIFGSMSFHYLNLIAEAREDVKVAVSLWKEDDIIESKDSVLKAKNSLSRLQKLLDHEILFKVPFVGKKLDSGEEIINSSVSILGSYTELVDIVEELRKYQGLGYEDIRNKPEAINLVGRLLDKVEVVFVDTENILYEAEQAGIGNWPIIRDALVEITRFSEYDVRSAAVFYPVLAKSDMTYLLLMQNNHKLMPTGGYIGNFGILKVENGEVIDFYLKDTPKFDHENKSDFVIAPPKPLEKYYGKSRWGLTDANWSPSFPLTARRAEALYRAQGGEEEIDGVIAFSPEIVSGWLDLVGGVTIDGLEYNSANFGTTPQYVKECEPEKAVCERTELVGGRTIEGENKKYIINPIAQKVREKLIDLPMEKTFGVVDLISKNVEDQHLFVYFNNNQLQEHVRNSGFAGDLLTSEQDYLMVVDSNLSTARMDQYVNRNIDYTVVENDAKLTAKLVLTYNYDKQAKIEDLLIPAYRNYFRVYAPLQAELKDGYNFDVSEDLGKQVFGKFISLNQGEEKVIELEYELPEKFIKDDCYELILQRQLGNAYTDFNINIVLEDVIKEYSPSYCEFCPDGQTGQIVWQGRLDENKKFIIQK